MATEVIDGTARYLWAPEDAPLLDWDDIRRLDAAGTLRFEPHTLTHPNLTTLGDRECRQEIEGSKVALEKPLARSTRLRSASRAASSAAAGPRSDAGERGLTYGITCEPEAQHARRDRPVPDSPASRSTAPTAWATSPRKRVGVTIAV